MWIGLTLSNLQLSDPDGKGVNWIWLSHVHKNFDWTSAGGKGGKNPQNISVPFKHVLNEKLWFYPLLPFTQIFKKEKLSHTEFQTWNTPLLSTTVFIPWTRKRSIAPSYYYYYYFYYLHIYRWDIWCFVRFRLFHACLNQYTAHQAVDCTTVERGQKLYQGCTIHCNIQTRLIRKVVNE